MVPISGSKIINSAKRSITKHRTTTRGTRRQRAPRGFWQNIRYDVLADADPPAIHAALDRKLARISQEKRQQITTLLESSTGPDRRESILRFLAGYSWVAR